MGWIPRGYFHGRGEDGSQFHQYRAGQAVSGLITWHLHLLLHYEGQCGSRDKEIGIRVQDGLNGLTGFYCHNGNMDQFRGSDDGLE